MAKTSILILIVLVAASGLALAQREGSGMPQSTEPALALKGHDPVALVQGKEEKGNPEIAAVKDGFRYLFSSQEHLAAFKANTAKYAVQDYGNCPVAKAEMGRAHKGDPSIFSVYEGKIYVFGNAEAKAAFDANPTQYVEAKKREGSGPPQW